MNLWGGRFTKPTNQLVYDFNASIKFDKTFASQDIKGSIGHVKMLTKQEILTQEEGQLIEKTLKEILNDVENETLEIDESYEDIHSFVESTLIERIGDTSIPFGDCRTDDSTVCGCNFTISVLIFIFYYTRS